MPNLISNKLDHLLRNPVKFLQWWEAAPQEFNSFLTEWRQQLVGKLRKEEQIIELYREQGEINAVEFLLMLAHEVREYQKGVTSGRFKKIGEGNAESIQK